MSNNEQDDAIKEVLSEIQAENEKNIRKDDVVATNEVESHPSSFSQPSVPVPVQPVPQQYIPQQNFHNHDPYMMYDMKAPSNLSNFVIDIKKNIVIYALIGLVILILDMTWMNNILSKLYGSISISYFDKIVKSMAGIVLYILLEKIVDNL